MRKLISVIKEIAETIQRRIRILRIRKKNRTEVEALQKVGYFTIKNFIPPDECVQYRTKIDELIECGANVLWSDSIGADKRLYFVNELDERFQKFFETPYFREILAEYTGITNPVGMVLAGRIDGVSGNVGSGGGWHRDSPITQQFKAICYLSNVEKDNGPFQYLDGSNSKASTILSYVKHSLRPGQTRFTDDEFANYVERTSGLVTELTGEQGTVILVDTKGIHRGKPVETGRRYALFCYFWDRKIPGHFEHLRQTY